jgi:hypothetical protein
MARVFVSIAALLVSSIASQQVSSQPGDGWVSLFDGKTISEEFDKVGETNWRVEDGAIVADQRTSKTAAFLVSKKSYKDLQVYVEFWASEDANSGIFVRCQNPKVIHPKTCYEANIFDKRKDPTYGTGSIAYFVEVNPMPKASGKWNTYVVTAKGREITVFLNGQQTAKLHNGLFTEGPFALQHNLGTIKFRKVAIRTM